MVGLQPTLPPADTRRFARHRCARPGKTLRALPARAGTKTRAAPDEPAVLPTETSRRLLPPRLLRLLGGFLGGIGGLDDHLLAGLLGRRNDPLGLVLDFGAGAYGALLGGGAGILDGLLGRVGGSTDGRPGFLRRLLGKPRGLGFGGIFLLDVYKRQRVA